MASTVKNVARKETPVQHPEARWVSPWDELERRFGMFGRRGWLQTPDWNWLFQGGEPETTLARMPQVDMFRRDNEIVVRAELPGVSKDDLDVTVDRHYITIKAQTSHEEKQEKDRYYRYEMSHGSYQRTLALPAAVDEDKVNATFKDGVLELTLPVREEQAARTVKIR